VLDAWDGGLTFTAIVGEQKTLCGISPIDAGPGSNVWCWGENDNGQAGVPGSPGARNLSATQITGDWDGGPLGVIPDAKEIAAGQGAGHFCVIRSRDTVWCWGETTDLQCGPMSGPDAGSGQPTFRDQSQEVPLPTTDAGAREVPIKLALGGSHSCVLTRAGSVYCWGDDSFHQLGSASVLGTCGADPCTGYPVRVTFPSTAGTIQRLVAGGRVTCGIDDQRHAFCWGDDRYGQIGCDDVGGNRCAGFAPVELVNRNKVPYTFDDIVIGDSLCGRDGSDVWCWAGDDYGYVTPNSAQKVF
jgi:alpha-tubulin suppressor-like RCC1 family protein